MSELGDHEAVEPPAADAMVARLDQILDDFASAVTDTSTVSDAVRIDRISRTPQQTPHHDHHHPHRAPLPQPSPRPTMSPGQVSNANIVHVLTVIGGLPATGKSTIARIVAQQAKMPYLGIDRIEHAVVASSELSHPLGPVGYAIAYELAGEQLQLGLDVIVECVNPIALTRDSWLRTAAEANAVILEVEVVCSDESEHQRRVESRTSDVEGLVKPTWAAAMAREYEPWSRQHLVVDSARMAPEEAAQLILSKIAANRETR